MAMRRPSMEPRRTAMAILVSVAVLGGCARPISLGSIRAGRDSSLHPTLADLIRQKMCPFCHVSAILWNCSSCLASPRLR